MGLKNLFDISKPIDEIVASTDIAPVVHKLGDYQRPVPMFGYTYIDDEENDLFEADHDIDFGGLDDFFEIDLDKIQQGDKVRYFGKSAIVKKMSFKPNQAYMVLLVGNKTVPIKLRLK